MLGVNFNRASAQAVQALQVLTREARQTESRISTGLKVADPRDNGAVYAIAMGQRSRIASYASIADGISRARGIMDVTLASGSAIADILAQMKVAASAARGEDLTADQRLALQSDYDALRSQIDRIASSAQFNGANLAGAGGSDLDIIISDSGSSGTIQRIRSANTIPVLGTPARISTTASGGEAVGGVSNGYVMGTSPDGRWVAFSSSATNLVSGDTNALYDIFLKDLETGAISRLSTDSSGNQASGGHSYRVTFSPDGQSVLFESHATNLVAGDTNGQEDIFLRNLQTGSVTRVSTDSTGAQATGGQSYGAVFSPDGQSMAFRSGATNLVAGDTNGTDDVFIKNLVTGVVTRVSTDATGTQAVGGASYFPSFSPDGRYLAFSSVATNLVSGDTNGVDDAFIKDLETGAITRISTDSSGAQAVGGNTYNVRFSSDGQFVVFESGATNLVAGDTNNQTDIFVKNLATGAVTRVSTNASGGQVMIGNSNSPSLSPDDRFVAFYSTASTLVAGDTNTRADIFVKDLKTGEVTRLSTNSSGAEAIGGDSRYPIFSPDGRSVVFESAANNLVTGDTNASADIFVRSFATASTGIIPNLGGYIVGNAGVTAADDTQFRIDGTLVGTVDITATMTVADYLEAVRTSTGGRVTAQYDTSTGEFTYETAAISGAQGVLSLTSAGTARSWLGHGLTGSNEASGQAGVITLTDQDWTVGGSGALSGVSSGSGQLLTAGGASLADAALDTALVNLNAQMALLGAKAKAIELQDRFNASFVSTMEKNLSNLVDADLARESARLQSLQIKQQLGSQALSIANQAPQMILSLFRG
jgi:flagellin-like hook-associated protein FlgL